MVCWAFHILYSLVGRTMKTQTITTPRCNCYDSCTSQAPRRHWRVPDDPTLAYLPRIVSDHCATCFLCPHHTYMNKRPGFLPSPLTLHLSSSLSLEGFLYLVTYLSFKNQIKYYLLSDTVPTPQARIQVLWLCPQSMRCTERFWWYSEHPTVGSLNPMLWTYVESLLCTSYFRCKN